MRVPLSVPRRRVAAIWSMGRRMLDVGDRSDQGKVTLRRVGRLARYNAWTWEKFAPYVGDRVLEIGAGIGTMTANLVDRPLVIATDVDPDYLRALRDRFGGYGNVEVRRLDVTTLTGTDWREARLDTVLCANVLEHIEDDAKALPEMYRALEPGGRLLLLVPAHPAAFGTIDIGVGHFRRYRRRDLVELLVGARFRVRRLMFHNRIGLVPWYVNGRLLRRRAVPGFQSRVNDVLVPLLRFEEWLPLPFGLSLIAVAEKHL
ncbi:MAG: class I SAM-dependent methyltransferase [Candidatus Rokubacteria bacterium]|nr:class I SAM-dependent methyltransferase [Candidatus Rokubacteria bacterium]